MRLLAFFASTLLGCAPEKPEPVDPADTAVNLDDVDADGVPADTDCDDADPAVGGPLTWYADADRDGFGEAGTSTTTCEDPPSAAANPDDCDDADATVNPGAQELCNDVDDDCDGAADEDAIDTTSWHVDADLDGYGDPGQATAACDAPAGAVADATDCDDASARYHPGASEADCLDPADYDCDGQTAWADADLDGFAACADCDDADGAVNPGAQEVCNGADDDCDGDADAGAIDASTWYDDADGDGHGDPGSAFMACEAAGAVPSGDDCDDARADVNPDAAEACDGGTDEDCDGLADDADPSATGATRWYSDVDADGYGDPASYADLCAAPPLTVTDATDCDDARADVSPAGVEVCDAADADEDCDGAVDDADPSLSDALTWYADADGDAYGVTTTAVLACDAPADHAASGGDCDDADTAFHPGAEEPDCLDPNDYNCDGSTGLSDDDADGYTACDDCNDASAGAHPGAAEVCDGDDNDCDGATDEDSALDAGAWYADADRDGYGDATAETVSCEAPSGSVADDTDCDDGAPGTHPGAAEVCDVADTDEDCDADADDADASVTGTRAWYADADGDGHGTGAAAMLCDAPAGLVTGASDCDDGAAAIHPGATEICNLVDDDCDGAADEDDAADVASWYADADADGYGDPAVTDVDCAQPAGFVADDTDCDDAAATAWPGALEYCNMEDDNCDGTVDEDAALDAPTWYADADADGYGEATASAAACEAPADHVADATDCDDDAAGTHPGAVEVCDAADADEDCDGASDDADASVTGTSAWYADADGDTFGAGAAAVLCDATAGRVSSASDCDDDEATIHPDATEICNGVDDDCEGTADGDDAADVTTWYADADRDGYGDPAATDLDCARPAGFVADDTDCDDDAATAYPGAPESCNAEDDDCDGAVDDAAVDALSWYADADADGYGDAAVPSAACEAPADHVADATDCDDDAAGTHPGAVEVCDAADADEDCDGASDDADASVTGTSAWYADADGDTFGAGAAAVLCDATAGRVASASDCDDEEAAIHPGATEICNGVDDDCEGTADGDDAADVATWYADADRDGYGDPAATDLDCARPAGFVADDTDCDDDAASAYPGAPESCNTEDDDCDGTVDDDALDALTWYADADTDGYGDAALTSAACEAPADHVADATDCDDDAAGTHPGAAEVCDAADTDEDCDGISDDADASVTGTSAWYADADEDAFGAGSPVSLCDATAGLVASASDCDDGEAAIHPAATERCNLVDDDCDAVIDEDDAADVATWYADADLDGYGDPAATDLDCAQPAGFVADDTDCDDDAATSYPGAPESCNAEDDDCDGTADDAAVDALTWYADADVDGYGDAAATRAACVLPAGYVADSADCDDADDAIHPGGTEVCDAADADEDCDGLVDDADTAVSGQTTFYADADADSYGTTAGSVSACDASAGYSAVSTDCDDAVATTHPGATEECNNGADDDCDGDDNGCELSGRYSVSSAHSTLVGLSASDFLGTAVSGAGDLNGDGYGDLVVSAYGYDSSSSVTTNGRSYLFFGPLAATDTLATADATLTGAANGDHLGWSLAGVSDGDADGYDELFVGADAYNNGAATDAGAAWLFDGPFSGDTTPSSAIATILGVSTGDYTGYDVASGDADADGDADLLVGAYGRDATGSNSGAAALFYGPVRGSANFNADVYITGAAATDYLGFSLDMAGDTDGDGADDLLLGAYGADPAAGAAAGTAYLFSAPATGTHAVATADVTITGAAAGDELGYSVAGAGDLDDDGYADVVLGAHKYNVVGSATISDAGAAYVVAGSATGVPSGVVSTVALATIRGATTLDYLGRTVDGGGDVNGDGYADLLVGGTGYDSGSTAVGAVFLLYGPMSGTLGMGTYASSPDSDASFFGGAASDALAGALALVPDVDGDGLDEIAAGAQGYDTSAAATSTGAVYLFLGGGI